MRRLGGSLRGARKEYVNTVNAGLGDTGRSAPDSADSRAYVASIELSDLNTQ